MTAFRKLAIVLLSLYSAGLAAAGDEAAIPASFDKYLSSPAFASRLSDALAMARKTHFASCESFKTAAPQILILPPVTMGDDGLPKSGQWKVSVAAEGCGKSRLMNVFFVVGKDNMVHFLLAAPGTTQGEFILQRDTVMYVMLATVKQTKDCKGAVITDTRFDAVDPLPANITGPNGVPTQYKKSWHETWTVEGCGHFYDVRVDYLNGTGGTTIMTSSDNVAERPSPDAKAPDPTPVTGN